MAYDLTLTQGERDALDMIGDRYEIGKLGDILRECLPDDAEWDEQGSITFDVPEHKAWEMQEARDADTIGRHLPYPMCDDDFVDTLETFFNQIV